MPFIANADADRLAMLQAIGVADFDELIQNIPPDVRLDQPLDLPPAHSELEALSALENLAAKNKSGVSFVGGGAYDHYSPAIVDTIISRSEFKTAYTPYQAEVSQGTLQSIYEFQTHICRLTGLDIANASMYDGASAFAEAIVLAVEHTKKNKVIYPYGLHPAYLEVAKTYLSNYDVAWQEIPHRDGRIDDAALAGLLDDNTAAVVVQQPNYFGLIENATKVGALLSDKKALLVAVTDPNALGILAAPADYGADIAVGEGQSLGLPLNFGGPYVGFFATKNAMVRKIPGRVVGISEDAKGRKGYILTLQTREQHIRREKATSNICTNSGLMALAATVYTSWIGKEGLPELGRLIAAKSHYLANAITAIPGYSLYFDAPFYKEFAIKTPVDPHVIQSKCLANGIKAGINISGQLDDNVLLFAVTEKRSKAEMDRLVQLLAEFSA